ncbi:MAG: helix-turn-helix domain-containing protein [Eubacteriales bacterium]
MKRFTDYIASLRRSKDLTQGELAGMLGVSHQAVNKWERGETIPGISKIETLLIYWVLP